MRHLHILRRALVVVALQLVSACADEGGPSDGPPLGAETARMALARSGDDLVLLEVDLRDGKYKTRTKPIAGWFDTVEGFSIGGPSAQLWANRAHTRAVMFGTPHAGTGDELHVLRGDAWERMQISDLSWALASPDLSWIVTSSAKSSEPFSEEVLKLFDYDGKELLSVAGLQGLSPVRFGPRDAWALLKDGQDAVVVASDGEVYRFVPALGAAGETDLGWSVSAAFEDRIIFHGVEDAAGRFVRVVHALDGTLIDPEPADFDRVEESYIVTPAGRVEVVTDSGFEDVCKLPTSYEPGFSRLVAHSNDHLLMDSQRGWSWFDEEGVRVATYVPTLEEGAVDFRAERTLAQSASDGMFLIAQVLDGFDTQSVTLDAFRFDGLMAQAERVATLPVYSHQVYFSRQPGSSWIGWAAIEKDLADDHADAFDTASGEMGDLSGLPRIEFWAIYGGLD